MDQTEQFKLALNLNALYLLSLVVYKLASCTSLPYSLHGLAWQPVCKICWKEKMFNSLSLKRLYLTIPSKSFLPVADYQ